MAQLVLCLESSWGQNQAVVRAALLLEVLGMNPLSDLEGCMEKEMATHSSTLVSGNSKDRGHGGLQSMGSQRVRHDCMTNFSFFNQFSSLSD